MSIFRPKDGDYIVRGIFLLFIWTCVGWLPLTFLGGVLAGSGGAAVGFAVSIIGGVFLYGRYLKLDPKAYPQNGNKFRLCRICKHPKDMHNGFAEECALNDEYVHALMGISDAPVTYDSCRCVGYRPAELAERI